MELFQILDCSTLDTCCSDIGILGVLSITRKVFELIQILVPIILILTGTIQFVQLTVNPELKDGFRKVLNKVIAAVIIFLLPVIIDVILSAVPNSISVVSCWNQTKTLTSENVFSGGKYSRMEDEDETLVLDPDAYGENVSRPKYAKLSNTTSTSTSGTNSMQQQIVEYAKSFANKGNKYKWGGYWNGSPKYTPTDCIGFVKGVYAHFGFTKMKNAPNGTQSFYNARKGIVDQISEKDLQPSDIVLWKGHIAIYIGNGKIVHAAGKKYGVITGNLYKGKEFRGFFRVKGVK